MKTITTFLLALLATATLFAQPYPADSYEINGETLVRWKGNETSIDMQADSALKNIKHIGENAFKEKKQLTAITFPDILESIGDYAFVNCSGFTGALTISDNVTSIGNYAFVNCSGFTGALTISDNVTSIGNYAFAGCPGFNGDLTIPNSVKSIGVGAFYDCSGFNGDLTIGNSVTSIGHSAFSGCKKFTGALTIPNTVKSIGNYAFYNCSSFTGGLTIGNNVTSIGEDAFSKCKKFTFVSVLATTPPGVINSETGLNTALPFIVPKGSLGEYKNHDYWKNFTSISGHPTANSYELSSDSKTLRRWKGKEEIIDMQADVILKKVKHIAKNAFAEPNGGSNNDTGKNYNENKTLKIIVFPEGLETIGDHAFVKCTALSGNLTIPKTVTSIGVHAFRESTFSGILTIPNSVKNIDTGAFAYCRGFTELAIGNSLKKISDYAFYECSGLTGDLKIEEKIETIGKEAFYQCTRLTGSLSIGENVTNIQNHAFKDCPFTAINVFATTPPEVTNSNVGLNTTLPLAVPRGSLKDYQKHSYWTKFASISEHPITNSYELSADSKTLRRWRGKEETVDMQADIILKNVKHIGKAAFAKPNGGNKTDTGKNYDENKTLKTIIFPEDLETIGDHAFVHCTALSGDLIIPNRVTRIEKNAFRGCSGFKGSLRIGEAVTSIGEGAFESCTGLSGELSIPNSVTEIEKYAFYNCSELTGDLKIGEKIKEIGTKAFYQCTRLNGTLTIEKNVTNIGEKAFIDCPFTAINVLATTPPTVQKNNAGLNTDLPLTVPKGSLEEYKNHDYWQKFASITEHSMADSYELSADSKTLRRWKGEEETVDMQADKILKNVKHIAENAFAKPNGGTNKDIGKNYDENKTLKTIIFPEGLETIGDHAFVHCTELSGNLIIPNNVTKIGKFAFYNCSGLRGDLEIGEKIKEIGTKAFYQCTGLTGTLTIGKDVTNIGEKAFVDCPFTAINVLATTPPKVQKNDAGLNIALPLTVPKGSLRKYKRHTYWKKFASITDTTVPSSINKVEAAANELRFYPSPVKGLLTVDCEKAIEAYALYSSTGVLLQSKKTKDKQLQIDMENYPSGIYFLRLLIQEEGAKTIKLIKR